MYWFRPHRAAVAVSLLASRLRPRCGEREAARRGVPSSATASSVSDARAGSEGADEGQGSDR